MISETGTLGDHRLVTIAQALVPGASWPSYDLVVPVHRDHLSFVPSLLGQVGEWSVLPAKVILIISGLHFRNMDRALAPVFRSAPAELLGRIEPHVFRRMKSAAGARNWGLAASTSKYQLIVDADDVYSPSLASTVLTVAESNSAALVLFSYVRDADEWTTLMNQPAAPRARCFDASVLLAETSARDGIFLESGPGLTAGRMAVGGIHHGSLLTCKGELGPTRYPEQWFGEDTAFCRSILLSGRRVTFVDQPLMFWRVANSSNGRPLRLLARHAKGVPSRIGIRKARLLNFAKRVSR